MDNVKWFKVWRVVRYQVTCSILEQKLFWLRLLVMKALNFISFSEWKQIQELQNFKGEKNCMWILTEKSLPTYSLHFCAKILIQESEAKCQTASLVHFTSLQLVLLNPCCKPPDKKVLDKLDFIKRNSVCEEHGSSNEKTLSTWRSFMSRGVGGTTT